MKFKFINEEKNVIRHLLEPNFDIAVLKLDRPNDYQSQGLGFDDIFDEISIRGWHFCFLIIDDAQFYDVENFSHLRSILRRCAKWYKAHVISGFIPLEKYTIKERFEDEYFKMQKSDKNNHWILAHKESSFIIEFEEGAMEMTQKVIDLGDNSERDFMEIARIMREMEEWLAINHPDKL